VGMRNRTKGFLPLRKQQGNSKKIFNGDTGRRKKVPGGEKGGEGGQKSCKNSAYRNLERRITCFGAHVKKTVFIQQSKAGGNDEKSQRRLQWPLDALCRRLSKFPCSGRRMIIMRTKGTQGGFIHNRLKGRKEKHGEAIIEGKKNHMGARI